MVLWVISEAARGAGEPPSDIAGLGVTPSPSSSMPTFRRNGWKIDDKFKHFSVFFTGNSVQKVNPYQKVHSYNKGP